MLVTLSSSLLLVLLTWSLAVDTAAAAASDASWLSFTDATLPASLHTHVLLNAEQSKTQAASVTRDA